MDAKKDLQQAVEAALLNSECDPNDAVEIALLCVTAFAFRETSLGLLNIQAKLANCWDWVQAEQK